MPNLTTNKNYHMGIYAKPDLLNWFVAEYPKHSKHKFVMGN